MRSRFAAVFVMVLVAGCGAPRALVDEPSKTVAKESVTVEEAFRQAVPLSKGNPTSVLPRQVPTVTLDNNGLLAIPVVNDGSAARTVQVKSYVARRSDGSLVLFYPVLTFVDETFRAYRTVKPKHEFAFAANVLVNEFQVPAGVNRMLVHTTDEYVRGSFVGTTSSGNSASRGVAVLAGIGGLAGALILQAATSSDGQEFRFSDVWLISIEIN